MKTFYMFFVTALVALSAVSSYGQTVDILVS
ncbi:MAG: hypothetical protein ACI9V1_001017 [Spirosomataceae bacterium]|jgi:hypothetical protein